MGVHKKKKRVHRVTIVMSADRSKALRGATKLISETQRKQERTSREFEYLIRESAEKYVTERRNKLQVQGDSNCKKVRNRRGREKFARLFHNINSRDRSK
jgi:hypothetical protein